MAVHSKCRGPSLQTVGIIVAGLLAALSPVRPAAAEARDWPGRAVHLIVPYGPGSAADVAARVLAEPLQKAWDAPVVVENRPGGDGLVAINAFVSANDSRVLFLTPTSIFIVHPYTQSNLPYEPDKDLQPIAWIANTLIALAVPSEIGIGDLKQLVAFARREPGRINYGVSPGFTEMVFDGFARENGLKLAKVPFRDISLASVDLGENRIQVMMSSFAVLRSQVTAGKIKLLGVGEQQRSDLAPDVPTVGEAGYPNLEATAVNALFGPRSMPLDLRRRVAAEVVAATRQADAVRRLRASGQQEVGLGVDELAAKLELQKQQVARIAGVIGVARKN